VAEALEMVAQDNLCLELAHMMDSFFGIFVGENNKEAAKITELMPRHNLVTVFGGETQEECNLKAELTLRMLEDSFPDFSFLPLEAMEDLTEDYEYVNFATWVKYFNITVRVQRVRGSFMIGALIDKLENMVGIEKTMREACTNQVGTTDDAFPPDDASTYLQPYHMGRSAYMEYDMYTNQGDKDDLIRIMMGYGRATITAMAQGMIIAAGAGALTKGMPMMDLAMPAAQPNLVQFMDTFTRMKMALDPNNISNRRWEYDTGTMKKIAF
jgi:hypothetical protein